MCSSTICPPLETNNLLDEMNGNASNLSWSIVPFSVRLFEFRFLN